MRTNSGAARATALRTRGNPSARRTHIPPTPRRCARSLGIGGDLHHGELEVASGASLTIGWSLARGGTGEVASADAAHHPPADAICRIATPPVPISGS